MKSVIILWTNLLISLQLASGIYSFACSLWNHHTDTFLQQVSSGNEAAVLSSLERTLLSLKGTTKLDMFIFETAYLRIVAKQFLFMDFLFPVALVEE